MPGHDRRRDVFAHVIVGALADGPDVAPAHDVVVEAAQLCPGKIVPWTRQSRAQLRRRALAGRVEQHRARRAGARKGHASRAPPRGLPPRGVNAHADFGVQPREHRRVDDLGELLTRNLPRLPQHARKDRRFEALLAHIHRHGRPGQLLFGPHALRRSIKIHDHDLRLGHPHGEAVRGVVREAMRVPCTARGTARQPCGVGTGHDEIPGEVRADRAIRLVVARPRQVCQTARAQKREPGRHLHARTGRPQVRGVEALQARRGCCKHERVGGNGLARHQGPISAHELEACCNSIGQNLPKVLNKARIRIFENKTQKILHLGVC